MHGLVDKKILTTDIVIDSRPSGEPEEFSDEMKLQELIKCDNNPYYFINNYVQILDDRTRKYVPFDLYPAQINVLSALLREKYIIFLKTRQFGASTLVGGAYFLWLLLFSENAHNLILSKSEREAHALMGDRFKPMFKGLPSWMKPGKDLIADSKTEFALSNGAKMFSLPTSAGDSYTARACMIDEAALVHNSRTALSDVLLAVEPTIAAGGQLILVSKTDKGRPESTFNSLFKGAVEGRNQFYPLFAPWQAVPWRDDKWYQSKVDLSMSINGTTDYVKENYPETWEEALASRELDKRLSYTHLRQCYHELDFLTDDELGHHPPPELPGLWIYATPNAVSQYIITADPAEGNPGSDDSCADVWDWDSGEQIASMSGRVEPAVFAQHIDLLGRYFGNAPVFVERNNHGHAVIGWLREFSDLRLLSGQDKKYGYNVNIRAKAAGYVQLAEMLREGEIVLHKNRTYQQLLSVEGSTLRAPGKKNDDHAISAMLFAAAKKYVHLDFLIDFV